MKKTLNSHDTSLIVLATLTEVLLVTVIGLRLWCRKKYMSGWLLDDGLIVLAFVSMLSRQC